MKGGDRSGECGVREAKKGQRVEGLPEQVFAFHRASWMHSHLAGPVIPVSMTLENWSGLWP